METTTLRRGPLALLSAWEASEWRFVMGTILVVLFLTGLPYLYAYLSTPPDQQFMGIMLDVPDHGQYFSWMRDLSTAHLVPNRLTPEPNQAIFFNLLWWGLGRLGLLLGVSYAGMYQALRFVSTVLFLLLVYRLCRYFIEDRLLRRVAFLMISLTSGLGWVLVVLKYTLTNGELLYPLDVYIAEGNTFLSILGYPHFIAAALYIFIFDLVLRGQERGQLRYAVFAGLVALFFGWQHAYDLVLVYGILGAYLILLTLRDRRLPRYLFLSLVIIGLISVWPALYSLLITNLDPVWKEVLAQFANAGVYSPSPPHLMILLGIPFLLAIYTLARDKAWRLKGKTDKAVFLIAWFVANFFLIYIPTDFQIHMLNGWQVPIGILATLGVYQYLVPWLTRKWGGLRRRFSNTLQFSIWVRKAVAIALVLVVLPTNLYLWAWRFVDLSRHTYPYYLHKDEVKALAWLEENASPNEVVLSSLTLGQYVPALAGTHAFLAHWAQTLDYYGKEAMVQEFYTASTSAARRAEIVGQFGVDYVIFGPAERELGDFNPAFSPALQEVFSSPLVSIYKAQAP